MENRNQPHPIFNNSTPARLPGATLYQGDCLAVIPGLEGTFDAVVTDPPYSSGGQAKGNRAASTGAKYLNSRSAMWPDFAGDAKDQRSYLHWSALWMALCFEKLNPGGLMIVFSDWRQLPVTSDALQAAGFTWRGVGVWDKAGSARPYKADSRLRPSSSYGEARVAWWAIPIRPGCSECSKSLARNYTR